MSVASCSARSGSASCARRLVYLPSPVIARPLRIEFPGALYHVLARGNRRQAIVRDGHDAERFLDVLARAAERHQLLVYAWCLMPNHYHLVVETPNGGLARALHYLNGVYAQAFNRRHQTVGHLFQGRYKAILVQREGYLLTLARYVVLNPIRAGLCKRPEDFRWSSYRATAGLEPAPPFLALGRVLAELGEGASVQAHYRRFVSGAGEPGGPFARLRGVVLGDDDFLGRAMANARSGAEIPRSEREPQRPSLAGLLDREGEKGMLRAYRRHGYTLAEIAHHLGCHYSTVSRRLRALEEGRNPPRRRRRPEPP